MLLECLFTNFSYSKAQPLSLVSRHKISVHWFLFYFMGNAISESWEGIPLAASVDSTEEVSYFSEGSCFFYKNNVCFKCLIYKDIYMFNITYVRDIYIIFYILYCILCIVVTHSFNKQLDMWRKRSFSCFMTQFGVLTFMVLLWQELDHKNIRNAKYSRSPFLRCKRFTS